MKKSGIISWAEDFTHLQNQLQKDQMGCLGGTDKIQLKRDQGKEEREIKRKDAVQREAFRLDQVNKSLVTEEEECQSADEECPGDTYVPETKTRKSKLNIMGLISNTGDRLDLSNRKKAMFAAACVKATGMKVEDTNISYSTACRQAKKIRAETAESIQDNFKVPDNFTIHWDGKMLKLGAGVSSERCCVYLAGADAEKSSKLLGIPEISSGSGDAQKEAVTKLLQDWNIGDQVKGQVFDTTASN